MSDLKITNVPISLLLPYINNARTHDDSQISQIAASIKEFGFNNPVLIDKDNTIIAGHGRVLAAKKIGLFQCPTICLSHLTSTQKKAYILADNRISLNAGWSPDLLKIEFEALMGDDFDLGLTGFGTDEIEDYLNPDVLNEGHCDADEVPALLPSHISNYGDVWILGRNRLCCGDSTIGSDVEKLMNGEKAELCFTSPPYVNQRDYLTNELHPEEIAEFISTSYNFVNLYAINLGISRANNEINTYWDHYIKIAKDCGMKLLSWNVWDRSGFGYTIGQATAMFAIEHEFIFIFGKDKKELNRTVENKSAGVEKSGTIRQKDGKTTKVQNKTGSHRQIGTVIRSDVNRYIGGDEHQHPATFPVALPEAYIEACTNPNDIVYDPFGGSGTTLIAAEKLGRVCLMMEIAPEYCDIIVRRWQKFTQKSAILESTQQTFDEIANGKTSP